MWSSRQLRQIVWDIRGTKTLAVEKKDNFIVLRFSIAIYYHYKEWHYKKEKHTGKLPKKYKD